MQMLFVLKIVFFAVNLAIFFIKPSVCSVTEILQNTELANVFKAMITSPRSIIENYLANAEEVAPKRKMPEKPVYISLASIPEIDARAVSVIDMASGAILYAKNDSTAMPIASLTKMMTALIVAERGFDQNEIIKIEASDRVGGNIEYFLPGDEVRFYDLLAASLVASSNTATNVIAKKIGGDTFVSLMNERAKYMHFDNTNFVDPIGLDPGNVSTVEEAARFVALVFARPEIAEILTAKMYQITVQNTGRKIYLRNTDQLLGSDLDNGEYKIIGGKTGYIDESGYNLALRVARGRNELAIVIFGAKTDLSRFDEARKLAIWAFENFRWP
jgi:D-alanyl-D-alanine carboxypeptidase